MREGGYTRRYMQNFGEDYVFSQRFYLGVPAADAWLIKSAASINRVANKDQLQLQLFLNKADKLASPVALKKVEVKIYEDRHYLCKEGLQTGSVTLSDAVKLFFFMAKSKCVAQLHSCCVSGKAGKVMNPEYRDSWMNLLCLKLPLYMG